MNTICMTGTVARPDRRGGLMGLARLMRMAFEGMDLIPLAQGLIDRAAADEKDANALMDLSTILQLQGLRDMGLATLGQALQIQRLYELPASRAPALRLLALMGPGDLMANAPLPFLFEHSDITLRMLYLQPGEPLPSEWPEHDLVFVAISETQQTHSLLRQLAAAPGLWTRPVLVRPEGIMRTARPQASELLRDAPGIRMPLTAQLDRAQLQGLCAGRTELVQYLSDGLFPLIVRPLDSHAGQGLERVDSLRALERYLDASPADGFFLSRFIDYSGPDGLFRKYRVVLIDGVPHAGHMGVSAHWMIHYLNAGMTESAAKRAEEERFMADFDTGFAVRHAAALRSIHQRFGLEYLVIDCAETATGELLVFELDPGAVVHSMDPQDLFPYKRPAMQKVFDAYRAMLWRAAGAPPHAV